jgi:D-alanyl-D-alanine carboxypeptidase/D-alanyl-D-alanine-endopeptidase (penicillin-binding protein 4)
LNDLIRSDRPETGQNGVSGFILANNFGKISKFLRRFQSVHKKHWIGAKLPKKLGFILTFFSLCLLINPVFSADKGLVQSAIPVNSLVIPKPVEFALKRNGIEMDAISIAISEIKPNKNSNVLLNWRGNVGMNPASTIKLLTTIIALDILGPSYRWRTDIYTDGNIQNRVLKGNLYFVGHGDPKLIPEELLRLSKMLRGAGIDKIEGNLLFDRSAYAASVFDPSTIDGESMRSYNVAPDPLLFAFRTLSFQLNPNRTGDGVDISYTPKLARFKINNALSQTNTACENWRNDLQVTFSGNQGNPPASNQKVVSWETSFTGSVPANCKGLGWNIVVSDANTFLTLGFSAAWEGAGGSWVKPPLSKDENLPSFATPLLQFEGTSLMEAVQDINKFSNNVMARQVFLTLALEKFGKPADTASAEKVVQNWLKQKGLEFPELVIENGSGLSRSETISANHLNSLLILAKESSMNEAFTNSLPLAGSDGTMRHRLIAQLRQFLHLKKKPEARIKTGSLQNVRSVSGYVLSKSGKTYALTSMINSPNASRGLEAHDQLINWLFNDGPYQSDAAPEPKAAR